MMNMNKVHVPHIETPIPGPRSHDALYEQGKYETSSISYPRSFPFAIKSIRDSVIEDLDGTLTTLNPGLLFPVLYFFSYVADIMPPDTP